MFLFPFVVLGAVDYQRTPSGFYVSSPITIDLSFDAWAETGCDELGQNYWGVIIYGTPPDWTEFISEFVASTTKSISAEFSLSVGQECGLVSFACSIDGETLNNDGNEQEEIDGGQTPIFEVIGNIITITSQSVASTTAYIGDLINSISDFLWLIIGIPLGFVVIKKAMFFIPK